MFILTFFCIPHVMISMGYKSQSSLFVPCLSNSFSHESFIWCCTCCTAVWFLLISSSPLLWSRSGRAALLLSIVNSFLNNISITNFAYGQLGGAWCGHGYLKLGIRTLDRSRLPPDEVLTTGDGGKKENHGTTKFWNNRTFQSGVRGLGLLRGTISILSNGE